MPAVDTGLKASRVIAALFRAEDNSGRLLEFQIELLILPPLLEAVDLNVAEQVLLVRGNSVPLD